MEWSSEQYLKFKAERTQPSLDLAARISVANPKQIIDLGCGPGNSSEVLAQRFPGAAITGLDNSPTMLTEAREAHPDIKFAFCDLSQPGCLAGYRADVVFSNACIQWVPDHASLLPRLMSVLDPGGQLCVQVPLTAKQPFYKMLNLTLEEPQWQKLQSVHTFHTLKAYQYFDILDTCASSYQVWETTYYHALPNYEAVLEWYRGSGLQPYLQRLDAEEGAQFEADIMAGVREIYHTRPNGDVLLPFPRLFFIANR